MGRSVLICVTVFRCIEGHVCIPGSFCGVGTCVHEFIRSFILRMIWVTFNLSGSERCLQPFLLGRSLRGEVDKGSLGELKSGDIFPTPVLCQPSGPTEMWSPHPVLTQAHGEKWQHVERGEGWGEVWQVTCV